MKRTNLVKTRVKTPASERRRRQLSNRERGVLRPSLAVRGLLVLEELARGPKTASEIARVLGTNRSSSLRLLEGLRLSGYATRDSTTKRYGVTVGRLWSLVSASGDHADWGELVNPLLRSLRDEFGEAAVLGVPAGDVMVYVDYYESVHAVGVRERLGTTRPMHCSALGKAYLSALSADALDLALGRLSYVGGTDRAPRGPLELRARLQDAHRDGYSLDQNETFEGASCVAVAAWVGGSVIGAAGVSGPSSRLTESRLRQIGQVLKERMSALNQVSRPAGHVSGDTSPGVSSHLRHEVGGSWRS